MNNKKELFRAIKFTLFSASAGIIQAASFALLNEALKLEYWISYLTALLLSVLWNFTVNRKFTFKSVSNLPIAMLKVLGFYAVFAPVSTVLGQMAEQSGVNEYLVFIATMLCNVVLEYVFCRYVVYRNSVDSAEKKKEGK